MKWIFKYFPFLQFPKRPTEHRKKRRFFSPKMGIFLIPLLIISTPLAAAEKLLNIDNVHEVMNEVLEQHVDKHNITTEILKDSFVNYINQFDPQRVYLFQSEVDRFLQLSDREMNQILRQYQDNNFSKYEELNNLIQNAILRARQYRREIYRQKNYLFQSSSPNASSLLEESEEQRPFATNERELKNRIRNQIIAYISRERARYGDKAILKNPNQILQAFENNVRFKENQYLYQNDSGQLLPKDEQQNLFVLHLLKALTRSLDSHTAYLQPNEALNMQMTLEKGFQGIGIVLERKPEGVVISRLIKDSPAEKSGLVHVNDQIQKINGENVESDGMQELANRLREGSNKTVSLVLKRDVKTGDQKHETFIPVTLARELIAVNEGRVKATSIPVKGGIIGLISLDSFYRGNNGITSQKDLQKAIITLQKQGNLEGIILDLRENSGGFLDQAVKVAGLFVTNGVIVISKFSNGEKQYFRDMDGKISFDGPLIVLTSKATASAAEIVAQVLQDYGVALVVGDERTYGKGTIQSQTVTNENSLSHFKVTIGKYYTVSGKTPQKQGVKADIVVPSYFSKELIGEEYLDNALEADRVNPAFKDPLSDIPSKLKPWFVHYYMPTLQKKETTWQNFLKPLKEKSEKRLAVNEDYLRFQNGELNFFNSKNSKDGDHDFQMKEAVNILKDMIQIDKETHRANIAQH